LDGKMLAPFYSRLVSLGRVGPRPDLSISTSAASYLRFFKEVLNG